MARCNLQVCRRRRWMIRRISGRSGGGGRACKMEYKNMFLGSGKGVGFQNRWRVCIGEELGSLCPSFIFSLQYVSLIRTSLRRDDTP
jgi:hypothetical protein